MAREAFSDPQVVRALAPHFPARVNAAGQPELLRKFRADTWPITLLIGTDGREIERATGYQSTAKFLAWLDAGLAGRGEFTRAHAARDAAPSDPLALARYGRIARVRGEADAGAALERALALDPENRVGAGEIALAALAADADGRGDFTRATALRERLRALARDPGNYADAMLGLAFAKFAVKGPGEAAASREGRVMLNLLIARQPDNWLARYYHSVHLAKSGENPFFAIREAETAAELAPGEHVLPTHVAKLHAEQGDYIAAVRWQRRAVKLHPWAPRYRDTLREYEQSAGLQRNPTAEIHEP